MSDLLDEAHEFLLCMDKMEYADALFALRAELTEARRQLKEASEQEPVVCVAVSVAVDAAHIAAKGQYQAAIHHLNRYAHQSYTRAPVPQPAVPDGWFIYAPDGKKVAISVTQSDAESWASRGYGVRPFALLAASKGGAE